MLFNNMQSKFGFIDNVSKYSDISRVQYRAESLNFPIIYFPKASSYVVRHSYVVDIVDFMK